MDVSTKYWILVNVAGVFFLAVFFLPTVFAAKRRHQNFRTLFGLNVCLILVLGVAFSTFNISIGILTVAAWATCFAWAIAPHTSGSSQDSVGRLST